MDKQTVTKYALGEMTPEERVEFEKSLESSKDLRQDLAETREIIRALTPQLRGEDELSPEQRSALEQKCLANIQMRGDGFTRQSPKQKGWMGDVVKFGLPLAAAASICVAILVLQNLETGISPRMDHIRSFTSSTQGAGVPFKPMETIALAPTGATTLVRPKSIARQSYSGDNELFVSESSVGHFPSEEAGLTPTRSAGGVDFSREGYNAIVENEFKSTSSSPLSTFSIDVDTASYSNLRRFLNSDALPPAGVVRTEEMINYFRYDYPTPEGEDSFSVNIEAARAPWAEERVLVRIGLRGKDLKAGERPRSNLVFLVDTSGSMQDLNKLPLLRKSLKEILPSLDQNDTVAIVAYAGQAGVVLPPTRGDNKGKISDALDSLVSGGATAGSAGIEEAYELATGEAFIKNGNNRVILCTDGDFNVGQTSQASLERLIEEKRDSGVYLTVLGFGSGNIQDSTMELLSNKGDGNYSYIDNLSEARKVLGTEFGSTLFAIAKDVKIQVEFNPSKVEGYRLIGYENRLLAAEDFNNDKKDAGEIGAGHTVTAIYEIVPNGSKIPGAPSTDPLKYQTSQAIEDSTDELLTVKIRYKEPEGDRSELIETTLTDREITTKPTPDFNFATAVAAFAMKLRQSPDAGDIPWSSIQSLARESLGEDVGSHRAEFLTLVEKTKQIIEREEGSQDRDSQ
jgi:Ca-activated chloride channel family protein